MSEEYAAASEREQRFNDVVAAYLDAVEEGRPADQQELLARHPDLAPELQLFFDEQEELARLAAPLRAVAQAIARSPPPTGPPLPDPLGIFSTSPEAGPRIIGDYELIREIGRGGMGVVFEARQTSLNRRVALKMVNAGPQVSPDQLHRFRNEAEIAANLDHPHIVPIYEVGEFAGDVSQPILYFSMKLIEGANLTKTVADRQHLTAGLAPRDFDRRAAQLMATIARAVHYAHQRGVLHRDLKPSNILLDAEGHPHVADFGLAKRLALSFPSPLGGEGQGEGDGTFTHTGAIVGSPGYMAPEQATGQRHAITTATDVYGLGTILYALLTGRPPFEGDSVLDTLDRVKHHEPRRPSATNPTLNRDLETICLKCLEKEPSKRYASSEALADDLERWLLGEPIQARAVKRMEHLWRWCRRHKPLVRSVAVFVFMVLFIGAAVVGWQLRQHAELEQAVGDDLRQADLLQQEERWSDVLQVLECARIGRQWNAWRRRKMSWLSRRAIWCS
jgi:eukaryotic-like serine/threonine-protein kinase